MSRVYRRSAHAEAVAPWIALTVILLMWWAGARTVVWMRPHIAPASQALDEPTPKESTVSAAPARHEPVLTADTSVTGEDLANLRRRDLMIPVRGVAASALVSSFADARSGHTHEAIDILAPRGTEVVAVEDGKVAKFFTSAAGGLTIYQFDPEGKFVYYYAHLDSYAASVKEGDKVQRGQVIGYVGTTGNAPKNTPHLHFAISKLDPDRRWWGGTALDPFLIWRGDEKK
jgi:murein DD-endopeptidase MepM/ murein hydrolase activator NlpD